MIGQLIVLLRVKELKEEQAFRVVNTRRQELAQAEQGVAEAQKRVDESAATLPARIEAAFDEIMKRDIEVTEIDQVKGKVLQLEKEHERLIDARERAAHIRDRAADDLAKAVAAHRQATKAKDKYVILCEELGREANAIATLREEVEIEDMFSTRRQKLA